MEFDYIKRSKEEGRRAMGRIVITLFLLIIILTGCAFGGYARADLHKNTPPFSPGSTKEQIVEFLGPPDKYVKVGNTEYLTYKTKKGFFVILFGRTQANDYEIKLVDEKFVSARWLPTGSSVGILAPQGSVAE